MSHRNRDAPTVPAEHSTGVVRRLTGAVEAVQSLRAIRGDRANRDSSCERAPANRLQYVTENCLLTIGAGCDGIGAFCDPSLGMAWGESIDELYVSSRPK